MSYSHSIAASSFSTNLKKLTFGIVIVHPTLNRREDYEPMAEALRNAVEAVQPGEAPLCMPRRVEQKFGLLADQCRHLLQRRARQLLNRESLAEFKEGVNLVARDGWIDREKIVDAIAGFQEIDQRLDRHSRSRETRRSVHDLGVDRDRAGQSPLLFGGHSLTQA